MNSKGNIMKKILLGGLIFISFLNVGWFSTYKLEIRDHIRVPPSMFEVDVSEAITKQIKSKYRV